MNKGKSLVRFWVVLVVVNTVVLIDRIWSALYSRGEVAASVTMLEFVGVVFLVLAVDLVSVVIAYTAAPIKRPSGARRKPADANMKSEPAPRQWKPRIA